jgi:hypothetical protein
VAESKFINPLFQRTTRPTAVESPPEGLRQAQATDVGRAQGTTPSKAGAPVKFTFYFSQDQLDKLDDLWVRAKLEHRQRLNKSEFVRLALDRLIAEFERDPKAVLADLQRQRQG